MIRLLLSLIACLPVHGQTSVPGWHLAGANPKAYDMALDNEVQHGGKASATIRCRGKHCGQFGTIMQSIKSDDYLDRRVRLSAWVKATKAGNAALWMRVDGPRAEVLTFDNMNHRSKGGTFDWRKQEVVLDVPSPGVLIYFGLILEGGGQAWIDDLTLEPVDPKTRSTSMSQGPTPPRGDPENVRRSYMKAPAHPVNPDFEQTTP